MYSRDTDSHKSNSFASLRTFRSLKSRNYRLFFTGQGISLIGTWMQSIALNWLLFRLTGSPFMLGISTFAGQIPVFLLAPVSGVIGDRFNRRKILLAVQCASMVQASVLAVITLTGIVQPWHLIFLTFLLGVINAFELPIRQALVFDLLDDKEDLPNAIALNSSLFNGSRLIGPAVAGAIVAMAGEGICFLINAVSYIASISAFVLMKIKVSERIKTGRRVFADMKEGFRYAAESTPVKELLILIALISFFALTFPVLLPVFASQVLHGDSHMFGFLVSSAGAGAFIATLYLASRNSIKGLGRIVNIALYTLSCGFIVFSFSTIPYLSMAALFFVGFTSIVIIASCNTILQTVVDESKRGRVMSLYVMAFTGTAPAGGLIVGSVSEIAGAPLTVGICGVCCFMISMLFSFMLPRVMKSAHPLLTDIIPPTGTDCSGITGLAD
ncbi:MAG TPA: MFS transporter [Spirochaetota bacterium]|nr:MFS transporter [Spirochaetota bacterium]HPJ34923.1 MFS transporter [Spirochaetota bacterium]